MSQGNGDTAEKTVLLNYQRQNPWIVQISVSILSFPLERWLS